MIAQMPCRRDSSASSAPSSASDIPGAIAELGWMQHPYCVAIHRHLRAVQRPGGGLDTEHRRNAQAARQTGQREVPVPRTDTSPFTSGGTSNSWER